MSQARYQGSSWGKWKPKRGRKLTLDEMRRTLVICDRVKSESDRLRDAAGLPRVPYSPAAQSWQAQVAKAGTPKARKAKVAVVRDVAYLVAERKRLLREREAIAAELRKLSMEMRERGAKPATLARTLGVSRQAASQMLRAA